MCKSATDFQIQLQIGIDELTKIIAEYKKKQNIEIELRLGQIQFNTFKSGLGSKDFYNKIKNTLDTAKCWDKVINNNSEELCLNGVRRTTSFNNKKVMKHQCIKKERILNKNMQYTGTPYDIRISVSKEIPTDDKIKSGTGVIRKKNRHSYYYKDYVIDLTIVEQIENQVSETIYELEVEFINLDSNVSDKYRAHSGLLLIHDVINMCEEINKDCKISLEISDIINEIDNMKIQ